MMIRQYALVLALGIITLGCQRPCANNVPTERVVLKATSYDHPLLIQQRQLIEHNRPALDSKGIQVYVEIYNPHMLALREMPENSFQVHLLGKNGEKKACYKGQVVSIATLTQSGPAPVSAAPMPSTAKN